MKRALAALALLATTATGCSSAPKPPEEEPRPVRFAILAAPEVGADDGDLLLAVTKLSREKDLAFVLVPGPLLAASADKTSLELLKNDLGQLAPPVYVAFAPVASGTVTEATPRDEDILTALEAMGPGTEHRINYQHVPPRAPGVIVNVLKWDGTGAMKDLPPGTKRLIQLAATTLAVERADVGVGLSPDATVSVKQDPASATVEICVPPLSRGRVFVIATLFPLGLEVALVPLEGAPLAPPTSLRLPAPRDQSPP